jgi:hypothetical protein
MNKNLICSSIALCAGFALMGQDLEERPLTVEHSDCSLFGTERERFKKRRADDPENFRMGRQTVEVAAMLSSAPGIARAISDQALATGTNGIIDKYIFAKLQAEGVRPAEKINDYEFIRRVTLDLTGRVPVYERVLSFVADKSADKRAKLVDELLASPVWIDKWTYYLGDRLKNTALMRSTNTNRQPQGREAFNKWIRDGVTAGKGYDQMVRELIAARGSNSFEKGELNWLVGGRVTGGPANDVWDQQAANIADTFLGMNQANCILCHNGRFHLDQLSLWGRNATRMQMWGMAAFLSKTMLQVGPVLDTTNPNLRYYNLVDNPRAADYPLGSTSGNRPARTVVGNVRNVAPIYPFSGRGPNPGEDYRDALAREVTADPQFARASVNYIWKEFFGRGIVNPVDQFDLARLDPDNPPQNCPEETPCTLQPSHPELLRDLATDFAANGFKLKDLMRQIVNSEAYQLSSRYPGTWSAKLEPLFARHMPRRLWGEEIADSISMASNLPNAYTYRIDATNSPRVNWAIQMPEPLTLPGFVQSFINGNRDDEPRRQDGAAQQALGLMNDAFVTTRIRATGTGSTASLLQQVLMQSPNDAALIDRLYLTILSRLPSDSEKTVAMRVMQSGRGVRADRASTIMWALFNKVDFIFNI